MTGIGRDRIAALIPHQGAMCLLDSVVEWDARAIMCRAVSHLSADNPLRHAGALSALAGAEYGLQAACLHGALTAGEAVRRPGFLAALRGVRCHAARLDDPALGALAVRAVLEHREDAGTIYGFSLAAEDGRVLLEGRASIATPGGAS
ncbi:MAG: hypothetical protein JSR21_14485 [Proteobacteria bacterium]|nr:hypothetical protein [Pseudomonadota bacterium]